MANISAPARKCCMGVQICSHSVPQPSVRCSQQRFESDISVCGCRDRKNQMCIEMLRHRGADQAGGILSQQARHRSHDRTSLRRHEELEGRSSGTLKPRRSSVDCRCRRWLVRLCPRLTIMGLRAAPAPPARRSIAGQRLPLAQIIMGASRLSAQLAPASVVGGVWHGRAAGALHCSPGNAANWTDAGGGADHVSFCLAHSVLDG